MISSKIVKLRVIDSELAEEVCSSALKSERKSQFSGIQDQPYNLFMESIKKVDNKELKDVKVIKKPL